MLAGDDKLFAKLLILMKQAAFLAGDLGGSIAARVEGGDGESVESGGVDGFEFGAEGEGHALDLDIDEARFGGGLAAETPHGGGHFADKVILNEVSGGPQVEVGGDKLLVVGEVFAGEDEGFGVSAVLTGVIGGAAFACRGFGSGGLGGVEGGREFALVVEFHSVTRVTGGLGVVMAKLFVIMG